MFGRNKTIAIAVLCLFGMISSAYAYKYFDREKLARTLDEQVGQKVKVVDELVEVYEYQEVDGYVKFDTVNFRCYVPESASDSVEYLKKTFRLKDEPGSEPALLTIKGKVDRPEFWGDVKGDHAGVDTEIVVIVVDEIKKPRKRYYREWKEIYWDLP